MATTAVSNLLNTTSHPTTRAASSNSEEKITTRFTNSLFVEGSKKKVDVTEHFKRLAYLRKEAEQLEKTDWQFEPVEKLLGK